ncbi:hypothetical protein [Streptomyces sp. NPDC055299]
MTARSPAVPSPPVSMVNSTQAGPSRTTVKALPTPRRPPPRSTGPARPARRCQRAPSQNRQLPRSASRPAGTLARKALEAGEDGGSSPPKTYVQPPAGTTAVP